jgi:hypothetical protein
VGCTEAAGATEQCPAVLRGWTYLVAGGAADRCELAVLSTAIGRLSALA